jgi:hypothetical protein
MSTLAEAKANAKESSSQFTHKLTIVSTKFSEYTDYVKCGKNCEHRRRRRRRRWLLPPAFQMDTNIQIQIQKQTMELQNCGISVSECIP